MRDDDQTSVKQTGGDEERHSSPAEASGRAASGSLDFNAIMWNERTLKPGFH